MGNDTIVFEGEEFKDVLHCNTKIKLSFRQRLILLFSPELHIEQVVYTKEIMPARKAKLNLTSVSYLDKIKILFRKKQGLEYPITIYTPEPNNL